jgi:outer membrane protein TolC
MKKLLIPLLLLWNAADAQTKHQFTVKQAVDYSLQNSVDVKNALLDIKIQEQVNRQYTALALPQASASLNSNHYFDIPTSLLPGEIINRPGTKVPVQFGSPWNTTAAVNLSQILFDGQVFIALKARKNTLLLSSKTEEVTAEQIKANVYKIYYQLVVGKKQLQSLDANIERFEKLLHDTKEIYKNGFAEKLDVDKVTVQLNNIKTEKVKIENQLTTGNAGLKFLMGMPQKEELVLTDTLSEAELKTNILDENYNYTDRKEMQLLSVAKKLAELNIRRYKLTKWPSLVAFAEYNKNAQRSKFDYFGKGDWFTSSFAGLKVSVPIFDGNNRRAHLQETKYDLQKVKNNIDNVKEGIDYQVTNARTEMKNAILTVDNQKQNMELAEKVYNTTKKKYEQGLGNNQEIYFAETELKVAQTNYYTALYDAITAKIDYLKAIGKL